MRDRRTTTKWSSRACMTAWLVADLGDATWRPRHGTGRGTRHHRMCRSRRWQPAAWGRAVDRKTDALSLFAFEARRDGLAAHHWSGDR